jgi:hypothetical protein
MKITFTREEVKEIILAHVNRLTITNVQFNTVDGTSYQSIPNSIEVSYEATVAATTPVEV